MNLHDEHEKKELNIYFPATDNRRSFSRYIMVHVVNDIDSAQRIHGKQNVNLTTQN
jgi:hypothetical protein